MPTKFINSKRYSSCIQLYKKINGDTTYYACYNDTTKLDTKGKPQKQRVKIGLKSEGITEQYAKAKYDELVTAQRLGEIPEPIKRKRKKQLITLNEVANLYFEQRLVNNSASKNIRNDKSIFNKHLINLANQDINSLTSDTIEKLKQLKQQQASDKTVNNILTLLSAILNYAKHNGTITLVPKIAKLRGISNSRERYFDQEEITQILTTIQSDQPLTLFVLLSLSTGGRLETIRSIKVKDINLKSKTISLTDYKSKSNKSNNISYTGYISGKLEPILKQTIQNKLPNDYVLQSDKGLQLGGDYIQGRLQTIFNKLFNNNLDTKDTKNRAVVHTLRHTFASLLAIEGTPIYTIQRLMNHSDIKMTLRYAKLSPDSGRDAVNKILNF